MTTRSKEQALDILTASRQWFIQYGRHVAAKLASQHGHVTSVEVIAAMDSEGAFDGYIGNQRWVGAVFGGGKFQKVAIHEYGVEDRNLHDGHLSYVWKLCEGVSVEDFPFPGPRPWTPAPKLIQPTQGPTTSRSPLQLKKRT